MSFKRADGSTLRVIQWITASEKWKCVDFAYMLLKDDLLVSKYEKECKEKEEFVRTILKDWLSRNDDDATDSAVPCAMLLDMAKDLSERSKTKNSNVITFLLFNDFTVGHLTVTKVFSLVNGHSHRRIPPISGQPFLHEAVTSLLIYSLKREQF